MRFKQPYYVTGPEIRDLRHATGLSQHQAANLFGVKRPTIANWEIGRRPAPKWAIILYRILGAKRQALITGRAPVVEIE